MKRILAAVCLWVAISGSAQAQTPAGPTTWLRPGATPADLYQDSARCRLVARSVNPEPLVGRYWIRDMFINGPIVAERQQRDFADCMVARGWVVSRQ